VTVAVLALTYLAAKLAYRLRDVLLLIVVAGFIALILNPFVVFVQRRVRRRGPAVAVVTIWAILVFAGLTIAFGYPLANGLTHLSHRLPEYVHDAENHVLNPVVMSRTVNVNPLLVLVSILIGSSIGDWFGGYFGAFVAALLSIPCAAALQVVVREIWRATAPGGTLAGDDPG